MQNPVGNRLERHCTCDTSWIVGLKLIDVVRLELAQQLFELAQGNRIALPLPALTTHKVVHLFPRVFRQTRWYIGCGLNECQFVVLHNAVVVVKKVTMWYGRGRTPSCFYIREVEANRMFVEFL